MEKLTGKAVRSVSFNLDDPHQRKLYLWAQQFPNFSDLVRRGLDTLYQQELEEEKLRRMMEERKGSGE